MTTQSWVYAVWFRDAAAHPADPEYEWVATLLIDAASAEEARRWGDQLARRRADRDGSDRFLRSEVRQPSDPFYADVTDWSATPLLEAGQDVDDDAIGW